MSGREVVSVFEGFGFTVVRQRGSHVKLRRDALGVRQTLTVSAHPELDTGTLRAIIRQASVYVPESELGPHFWSR